MKPFVLSKFTKENFDKIRHLDPMVHDVFVEFLCRIAMEGIYIRIPDDGGKRTSAEQKALYNKIPKVTWVLCPYSAHCHGLAIDIVPLTVINAIRLTYATWYNTAVYERIARIAMELGIQWGFAVWGTDKPHFQYLGGLSIDDVAAGKMPPAPVFKPVAKPVALQRAVARCGFVTK